MAMICMSEEYWRSSQYSIVRYYGHIKINSHTFMVVNKDGVDVFALSCQAEKTGNSMAIPPGEPCDLVRTDFIPFYKALKRDKYLEVLEANQRASDAELKAIYKKAVAEHKKAQKAEQERQAAERAKREPQLFSVMTDYIKQGDCLELMAEIPDHSIDMVLCDLPYGVLNKSNEHAQWDNVIDMEALWGGVSTSN